MNAMSTLTAIKTGASVVAFLKGILDPHRRRALDEAITDHVLSEIPRVVRLLEERIAEVIASGCTPEEASLIAYQVIEAQKRTIDTNKRRRLSNVLVNGLSAGRWDKVKHRFLIRLTCELEDEHVALLQWYAASPEERKALDNRVEATLGPDDRWDSIEHPSGAKELRATPTRRERYDMWDALARELVSFGVLLEEPTPSIKRPYGEATTVEDVDVELDWSQTIAPLGHALLKYLKDPEDSEPHGSSSST